MVYFVFNVCVREDNEEPKKDQQKETPHKGARDDIINPIEFRLYLQA